MRPDDLEHSMRDALPGLRSAATAAHAAGPDLGPALRLMAEAGLLRAVLPEGAGGCGLGWRPAATRALCDLLRALGRTDLSLARLFEGHVNAAVLV